LIAGWVLAVLLAFGPAVSNSFARFAYALVLPAMREDLLLNYAEAGWLNTANAAGYLAGALLTRAWVVRAGNRALFMGGMLLTSLAVLATGLTRDPALLSLMRLLGGVGGAAVFVCGGALSGHIMPSRPSLATTTIALYFAGGGIGLMLCGAAIPLMLDHHGVTAWPLAWQAMGVTALVMTALSIWAALRIAEPGEASRSREPSPRPAPAAHASTAPLRRAMIAYLCFGLGYIGYMTFVIAWMREHGAQTATVITAWMMLGFTTLLAPAIWRGPVERWSGGRPLAAALATLACGASLPLLHASAPVMMLSAALFGAAMFSIPSAIQSLVKKGIPMRDWGHAMAGFTVIFAAGQVAGPVLTGWLADLWGSLTPGLALSVLTLCAGALLGLTQRDVTLPKETSHA
jgi:MFS family permease